MISIRIHGYYDYARAISWHYEMCFLSSWRFADIFSPPPLLGGTVILEVKVLLIANLLPADRSTETSEARRIQRWWSVVICPLTDDTTALNIRAIS